ncbi:MAG: hypothetical protein COA32_10370 [Fluviicola sp.]|nr:MAG: hypothetical protein COA32_10370 [Fluviicola sp.]
MRELKILKEQKDKIYNYWLDLEKLTNYHQSTVTLKDPLNINGIEYSSLTGSLGVLQPSYGKLTRGGAALTVFGVAGWDINLNTAIRAGQTNSEFKEGVVFIPFDKVSRIEVINIHTSEVKMVRSK